MKVGNNCIGIREPIMNQKHKIVKIEDNRIWIQKDDLAKQYVERQSFYEYFKILNINPYD